MNFREVLKLRFITCNSKKDYSTNGLLSLWGSHHFELADVKAA
jgi:hypothetical protein